MRIIRDVFWQKCLLFVVSNLSMMVVLSSPALAEEPLLLPIASEDLNTEVKEQDELSSTYMPSADIHFGTEQLQNPSGLLTYNLAPVPVAEMPILSSQANDLLVQSSTDPNLADPPSEEPASQPNPVEGQVEPPAPDSTPPATESQPANTPSTPSNNIWKRSQLTGDWDGARSLMARKGFTFNLEWTQFFQGLAAGRGASANTFEYGGRLDALFNIDTGKLGLWEGGGIHAHLEYRYDQLPAFRGGALVPVNTAAILPLSGSNRVVASSLYFSQKLGPYGSLLIGKINGPDLLAGDLFFGGWGNHRFMSLGFAAPTNGVTPPVFFGSILNLNVKPVVLTFMVFDPNNQTNTYWPNNLFGDGVGFTAGVTYPRTIAGRPTVFGLSATYSTKEKTDLNDVLLPFVGEETRSKRGSYSIAFKFSHLLHLNRSNPREGWGIFLNATIADGNPNPFGGSVHAGIGGKGLFRSREQDSFGIGYYYYNFSNALQNAVKPLLKLDDEHGVEAFYSFAVTPWFHITGNLQYIDPATSDRGAFLLGLRTNLRF
jgi:porin